MSESMMTAEEIPATRESVAQYLDKHEVFIEIDKSLIEVKPYGVDKRIGWNTYIVTLKGYGVFGFTDGPID